MDRDTAFRNGLIEITEGGRAIMRVDNWTAIPVDDIKSGRQYRQRLAASNWQVVASIQLKATLIFSAFELVPRRLITVAYSFWMWPSHRLGVVSQSDVELFDGS